METATVPTWSLSDRLVKARKTAGLNQTDLAHRLNIDRKTLGDYERGKSARYSTLIEWAQVCGVDANWLLTGGGTSADNTASTHGYPGQLELKLVA